jgi:hypothetical protein
MVYYKSRGSAGLSRQVRLPASAAGERLAGPLSTCKAFELHLNPEMLAESSD